MILRGIDNRRIEVSPDQSRRAVLKATALLAAFPVGLVAACKDIGRASDPAAVDSEPAQTTAFSARFVLPAAGGVRLDFQDARRFSLSADTGPGSTIVSNGDIYLHVAPSIVSAGSARLLLLGRLAPEQASTGTTDDIVIKPANLDGNQGPGWKVDTPLFEAAVPARDGGGSDTRVIVAKLPGLARAQHVAATQLSAGMNMSLCGDAVARLLATWPSSIVQRGLAVLSSSSGIRMDGPIEPLGRTIGLPGGIAVEDYRISPG